MPAKQRAWANSTARSYACGTSTTQGGRKGVVLEEHESMVTDGEHSGVATTGACHSDPCGAVVLTASLNLGCGRAEEEVEEEGG